MVSPSDHKNSWVLDSGCTFHMCTRKEWFQLLQPSVGGNVHLGDDTICDMICIGNIQLEMFDGSIKTLKDVRFILDLKRNLISIGQLDKSRLSCKIDNGKITVSRGYS